MTTKSPRSRFDDLTDQVTGAAVLVGCVWVPIMISMVVSLGLIWRFVRWAFAS